MATQEIIYADGRPRFADESTDLRRFYDVSGDEKRLQAIQRGEFPRAVTVPKRPYLVEER